MLDYNLLIAVLAGIILLLTLILRFKIQAFIALLISSITVGLLSGMDPNSIMTAVQKGMGETLGFVAVVIGLGAMFGAILEHSGGAEALAKYLLQKFGERRSSWALMLTGFFVAIPVFFDVAFIILVPIIYALQRKTGKSLLLFAIPLLSGLAVTHAFIPPTPGPVAVADILKADLGWVILFGSLAGLPAAIIAGPIFGKYIGSKMYLKAPDIKLDPGEVISFPPVRLILFMIGLPIVLILLNTLINSPLIKGEVIPSWIKTWISLIGHPFSALIIANLLAWYFLGILRGFNKEKLLDITTRSAAPAGIIILLTGAGGVFKQILVDTGTGEMLARYFAEAGITMIVFAFIAAALIRILQGSATVAMITAAGLTSPLLLSDITELDKALVVISIASGACILSHVNDSGFWLVSKYLGLSEKQTFKSFTIMTTIVSIVGLMGVLVISAFI